jgi:hypothetical protein
MIPEGIFEEMKAANLTVIPTLTVYMEPSLTKISLFDTNLQTVRCSAGDENCTCSNTICTKLTETGIWNGNTHFFQDPLLNDVAPKKLLEHYYDFNMYSGNSWIQWGVDHNKMGYQQRTLRQLIEAGVRVLSGTDTMWEATFFGFSLHRELELMALSNETLVAPQRPITNMEIRQTTTSNVHDFLGHNRGRFTKGFWGDFVVLNQSPLDDIKNSRNINMVIVNGTIVDRELLRKEKMAVD